MLILPIALATTAAAALVNTWLGFRIGRIRGKEKIWIGDGSNPQLTARMRAQLNFAEYVPLVLVLIALIELATGSPTWLWIVAGIFIFGRVCHGFGMDGWMAGRMIGAMTTMLTMLGLGIYAALIPYLG